MYLYSVAFAVGTVVAVAGIAVVVVVVGIAVGLTKQSHLIGMKYLMFVEWSITIRLIFSNLVLNYSVLADYREMINLMNYLMN